MKGTAAAFLVVLAFVASVYEARITIANFEAVHADARMLLQGSAAVLSGSADAIAALPKSRPNFQTDRSIFGAFVVLFFAFNWGTRLLAVEPLVRCFLTLKEPQVAKFAQSVMEAIFYGGFSVLGVLVLFSHDFVWPSKNWWIGFQNGGHELMRPDLRCFYIMYIARYFQAGLSVFLEFKRKDFAEMLLHHVVTVVVTSMSYAYGWNHVGLIVMTLLDPADVPLHLAKLCKYIAEASDRKIWQFIADRLFEVFAVLFFVTRIGLYGYVCWSTRIESKRYIPGSDVSNICEACLLVLLALQVYWFYLIIKVAVRLASGKGAEDPRSDDEEEEMPTGGGKKME